MYLHPQIFSPSADPDKDHLKYFYSLSLDIPILTLIFLGTDIFFLVKDGICKFQHDAKGHKNVKH